MNDFLLDQSWVLDANSRSRVPKVRVLWWNIQYGATNRFLRDTTGVSCLDHNLQCLVESDQRPDILVFGEWSDNAWLPATTSFLEKEYPFISDFYAYPKPTTDFGRHQSSGPVGIKIYSRFPIKLKRRQPIDFYPNKYLDPKSVKSYKNTWLRKFPHSESFPRDYLNFEILGPIQFHLIPVHLMTPFEAYFQLYGKNEFLKLLVKVSVAFGTRNPLYYQLVRLKNNLQLDFGELYERDPFLLLGDFNFVPKYILETSLYKLISQNLQNSFGSLNQPTWPARNSKESEMTNKQIQLDLCFSNKRLLANAFEIPLKGSDHYPFLVDLL